MKRLVLLIALAACTPKAPPTDAAPTPTPIPPDELTEAERAAATPAPTATPAAATSDIAVVAVSEDELPEKATLLWKADPPLDVPKEKLLVKDGTLKKVAAAQNDDNQSRHYPYAIDYWGITRTELADLLEKNVGKPVRIKGHYRKIWSEGQWSYEVDPASIVLLPK